MQHTRPNRLIPSPSSVHLPTISATPIRCYKSALLLQLKHRQTAPPVRENPFTHLRHQAPASNQLITTLNKPVLRPNLSHNVAQCPTFQSISLAQTPKCAALQSRNNLYNPATFLAHSTPAQYVSPWTTAAPDSFLPLYYS